jgi:hypothetical protein
MSEITGYTFSADQYCPDDMRQMTLERLWTLGERRADRFAPGAEDVLDELARILGVNRADEYSFDSGYFPKVIFGSMAHDGCSTASGYDPGQCGDACGACGYPLGGPCPNGYEGPNTIPAGTGDAVARTAHYEERTADRR